MKTKKLLLAMMALIALAACTEDVSIIDAHVIQEDPNTPVLPVGDFAMWPTPTIDDSDLQGEYYAYVYWHEHKAEAQTGDELIAMCNVPDEILKNMSTPNLVRTCFKHPYNNIWQTYNNAYEGILSVMTRFNGYAELMKRRSGVEATLDLFTQLGYHQGTLMVSETDMVSWTLVMCTAADYSAFNQEQVSRLAQDVSNKNRIALQTSSPNLYLSHYFYTLLGAFIVFHYDDTLPDEQRVLIANFIRYYSAIYQPNNDDLSRSYSIIYSGLDRLAASVN
jgi:hypothetical protein